MNKSFLNESEFTKILNTLLEPAYGLFYRRNYEINDTTNVFINGKAFGSIKDILNKTYINENINEIYKTETKNTYIIKIDKYQIILKKKLEKKDLIHDENTLLINFENKNIDDKYNFYSKQLLFNMSKHKYVPYIELITELDNIEIDKIAKIKKNDQLIKFYGFNKGDICKIIYKSNKINNINLYFNYRLII